MKCKSCGYHKNDDTALNCSLCGALLATSGGAMPSLPPADVTFGGGNSRGAKKKVQQASDGPSDDQIVYAGDFAICYAFVMDDGSMVLLKPGEVFTFGRGDVADHRVDSKMVSRRHARIHWQGTEPAVPQLIDLGSRNGVSVNGVPVREKLLEDGDEVALGLFTATLRVLAATVPFDTQLKVDRLSATTVQHQRMSGEIKLISIPWLLGHLERTKESGTLFVHHEKQAGYVALISGVVIAAGHGEHEGEEGVRRVAKMKQGRFAFSPRADATPQSIGKKLSEILQPAGGRRPRPARGGPPRRKGPPPPAGSGEVRRRPPPPGGPGRRRQAPPPGRRRPPPPR
jgi:pSer/pThr/pTyr-binding forkhead associated (FHA) protein